MIQNKDYLEHIWDFEGWLDYIDLELHHVYKFSHICHVQSNS